MDADREVSYSLFFGKLFIGEKILACFMNQKE
jgi:hypothetical protein